MPRVPEWIKPAIRRLLFRPGLRPRRLRGGALAGYRFLLNLHADTQVWRGIYEQDLQLWLRERVKPGDVCIDIGSAEGYFTLLMASLAGAKGRVLSVEPSSRGDQIQQNLSLNAERDLAPVAIKRAYAGKPGVPVDPGGPIPTVAIDQLIAELGISRVSVVKIDVDGGEIDVLEGMSGILKRDRPHLTVEVHSQDLLDGVESLTAALGYKMRRVDPPAHEHRPIPFNPTLYSE